jgi:hypothetical protein
MKLKVSIIRPGQGELTSVEIDDPEPAILKLSSVRLLRLLGEQHLATSANSD